LSQKPSERSLPTRRGFLVGLLSLAVFAPAGCGSDSGGDFGQQFEKPKDSGPNTAPTVETPPPSRRRSDEIREDRENARKKAAGRTR